MTMRHRWVFLSYRLPRDPSAPRLAVWRRLKRLGVAQLLDGLVALPLDSRNREQLEWAAEQVTEAGGEAAVWLAEATTQAQSREIAQRMSAAIAEQYREVGKEALASTGAPSRERRTTLARLRRELGRIRRRDYFPPPEREAAHSAVESLAQAVEDLAA
jgi:Protein ChrB, N-terminal